MNEVNPQEVHESNHGNLYNDDIWKLLQIKKYIKPTLTAKDCPKKYNIYYLEKKKILRVFGETIPLKGLVRIPNYVMYVKTDKYENGELVKKRQIDHVSEFVFKTSYFMAKKAKIYRKSVCDVCPKIECSFNSKHKEK
jgi:hypothetical protein